MKKVIILGSTGSIGTQTLEVIDNSNNYQVIGLACGANVELLKKQIRKYRPKYVFIGNEKYLKELKEEFFNVEIITGETGLVELASKDDYDILVSATSGIVSVKATLEAIKKKKKITLANKETLVMAGDIVMNEAKKNNVDIIPIDSEHSAILQCLSRKNDNYAQRLWITASGGPFLNNTKEEMANFTAKEALNHPRWNMGKKITVDCATLVNKALEVIEAHHLYNFNYENIKVVIHPQSIVHSMVEFIDGSFLAQMGIPSMHIPIQYALSYPDRHQGIKTNSFNIYNQNLQFLEPNFEKFPLLKTVIEAGKIGGIMPAVANSANEVAVYKFLNNEITFLEIEKIINKQLEKIDNILNPSLEEIFEADKKVRADLK